MEDFYAKTSTPQIHKTQLNEITRLIKQMNLTLMGINDNNTIRLINVFVNKGAIQGSFTHDRNLFFKVQANFIIVFKPGFICNQNRYKLLVKHNLDIIFPDKLPFDEEEDKCCAIF